MKNRLTLLVIGIMFISGGLFAQEGEIKIVIAPMYGSSPIVLANDAFKINNADQLQIQVLRFYISGIRFLKNGKVVLKEENSFHLIDAVASKSLSINIAKPGNIVFDEIQFNLGIDSTTNEAGVKGGELDPTKGMYWAWQSGYINFKLEGTSSNCNTRNNEFQFHLGGYLPPNYSMQLVSLKGLNGNAIGITLDIEKVLSQIDLAITNHIMAPSAEAVRLSKIIAGSFSMANEN